MSIIVRCCLRHRARCRHQEDPASLHPRRLGDCMIKQTYSVYINGHAGMKKWHLSPFSSPSPYFISLTQVLADAYWTQETIDQLQTIDDIPQLRHLQVPEGLYVCARTNRMRDNFAKGGKVTSFPAPMIPPYHPSYTSYPVYSQPSGYAPPMYSAMPRSRSNTLPSPGSSYVSASPSSSRGSWPPSPVSGPAYITASTPVSVRGLALAPLEQLRHSSHRRRDPTDEQLLRSLDRSRW